MRAIKKIILLLTLAGFILTGGCDKNDAPEPERIEVIGEREYLLVDSQWIFINEVKDTVRFSPKRIIVRFTEEVTDIQETIQALNIADVDIASGPSSGGFYVFHISTVDRGFEVMRKLYVHPLVESVSFSIYGERFVTNCMSHS